VHVDAHTQNPSPKGRRKKKTTKVTCICRSRKNKEQSSYLLLTPFFIKKRPYFPQVFLKPRFWAFRNKGGLKTRGKKNQTSLSGLITKNVDCFASVLLKCGPSAWGWGAQVAP
jgi:hypothetical protein